MIQQWVYAYSCWNRPKRAGEPAVAGFGTHSWTDGLSPEDIEELEIRCGRYDLPSWAPANPDATTRARLPLAVQSFRLASGKRAIVKAAYTGEGFWNHRPGAILVHGMVKEAGDWDGYPAEWMDSETFWKELPEAVRAEAVDPGRRPEPPALPALEDGAFVRSGNYAAERVAEHFRDRAARAALVRLATLWAGSEERPGDVGFGDDGQEAPWLVAGFGMLFPAWMSQDLGWATRRFSNALPEAYRVRGYEVAGMDPGMPCARLDRVEADPDVEAWVGTVETERDGFFGFLGELRGATAREWRWFTRLYRLVQGRADRRTLDKCLDYAAKRGTETVKRQVVDALARQPDAWPQPTPREWLEALRSKCGGTKATDAACARLLLEHRGRFAPGAAEECFLDWLDRDIGAIGTLWLERCAAGDGSNRGLLFTVAAAAHGGSGTQAAAEEALARVVPAADADWRRLLAFAAGKARGLLAVVLEKCPDAGAAVDFVRNEAADAGAAERLEAALQAYAARRSAGTGPGKADFLRWASEAVRRSAWGPKRNWSGLAAAFGGLRTAERKAWTGVLLPLFLGGAFPDDPREGAVLHREALRFFTTGMDPDERRRFVGEYAGKVAAMLDRNSRKHPAGNTVFGSLARLALGADEDAAVLRGALLAEGYPKGRFTDEEFEAERRAPALSGLSVEEERGWALWKAEREESGPPPGWLARLGRWFAGEKP